ncbi:reverse transcriptase domain-containing protein [Hansschlegelia plantiphila]|uniref:Reverse transcriptase domain-containing protein n=1 Tax=Hansschlegelia plantiphila TaxID=374655 RepID=A0A9W6J3J2_9HYPH|nr:reverse transcriptase domain-containing protein [Hansschlegelia plantiphila]GLK69111.1 hypothetical protein GCM10008179_27490 [Hansschlegelia plantiphila]
MTVCRTLEQNQRPFSQPPRPWVLPKAKLKTYRHFDAIMSIEQAEALANDPARVAAHAFYPLLRFDEIKRYFRRRDQPHRPSKLRPLRYAARSDAYIYMRYRDWLSALYEERLMAEGLDDVVLAYRRVASPYRPGNKCNIDFAYDAVNHIRRLGDCYAICLDIKSFFENLDHARLKRVWASVLGLPDLPPDHYRVFRSLTKYVQADLFEVYRRLGIWGQKTVGGRPTPVEGYLVDRRKIPVRLCDAETMREIVFGDGGKHDRIAEVRTEAYGIPQGTPISDLLANMYMLDFDAEMKKLAASSGGVYMRYSDDILFVVPAEDIDPKAFVEGVSRSIGTYGDQLQIAKDKTSIHRFTPAAKGQTCQNAKEDAERPSKRFEYLGFSFDGQKVRIRDSTMSSLVQKVAAVAKREGVAAALRYPSKSVDQICEEFNYAGLYGRFLRVRDFETVEDKSDWTFWTYVRKIESTMKADGRPAMRQVRNLKVQIRRRFRLYVQTTRDGAPARALQSAAARLRQATPSNAETAAQA